MERLWRLTVVTILAGALALAGAAAGPARGGPAGHAGVISVARPQQPGAPLQSTNWFGYNQGLLERGTAFHAIAADWVVPTATQHTPGRAENSVTWVGIGGGCVNADCTIGDATLIQAGTGQDVDAAGAASYYAWYEVIPAPAVVVASPTVGPGDLVHVEIAEAVPGAEVWTIAIQNVSRGQGVSVTLPYSSTYASAEWIEEGPVVLDSSGVGFAALPTLTPVRFDHATANGVRAGLRPTERIEMVAYDPATGSASVVGTPSLPDAQADGFAACAYATSCPVPRR